MPGCAPSFPSGTGGGPACALGGPGGGPGGHPGGGSPAFRAELLFSVEPGSLANGSSWVGSEDGVTFAAVPALTAPAIGQQSSPELLCASAGRAMYFVTAEAGSASPTAQNQIVRYDGETATVVVPQLPVLPSQFPGIIARGLRVRPRTVPAFDGSPWTLTFVAGYCGSDIFGVLCDRRQIWEYYPLSGTMVAVGASLTEGGRVLPNFGLAGPQILISQLGTFGGRLWTYIDDSDSPFWTGQPEWVEVTVPVGQQGTGGPNMLDLDTAGDPLYAWVALSGILGLGLAGVSPVTGITATENIFPIPDVTPPDEQFIDGKYKFFIEAQEGGLLTYALSPLLSDPFSLPTAIVAKLAGGSISLDFDFRAAGWITGSLSAAELGQPVLYRGSIYWPRIGSGELFIRSAAGTYSRLTIGAIFTGSSGTVVQSGLV